MQFGFSISRPRAVDLDRNDLLTAQKVFAQMPSLEACIACGGCTATCTAGNVTDFNFRKVHTLLRRGEYSGIYDELEKCMLCGKCRLVCPRGINTRGVVQIMKRELRDY